MLAAPVPPLRPNLRVNLVPLHELAFHRELVLIHRPASGKSLVRDLFAKCLFESSVSA